MRAAARAVLFVAAMMTTLAVDGLLESGALSGAARGDVRVVDHGWQASGVNAVVVLIVLENTGREALSPHLTVQAVDARGEVLVGQSETLTVIPAGDERRVDRMFRHDGLLGELADVVVQVGE